MASDAPFPPAAAAGTYEGVEVAASYGDTAAEWALLDGAAGLLDARWRRFFAATGEERREFLHGQTTAHISSLAAGAGCAAATLTAQGRALALFAVYESGDRLWIASTAAQAAATRAALSRFLVADDCDFEDDIDARCLGVAGPRSAEVLVAAGAGVASSLPPWGVAAATIAGQAVMLFSRGDLRVPAFDVLVAGSDGNAGDADAVARALASAGACACGVDALEIVRVESGTARCGVDVDDTRIAVEARLEWAIHFDKGCYVGQEVIERAVSRGRINHELCLLKLSEPSAPGAHVEGGGAGDVVTSVAASPRLGLIALAYLPRASSEPGTAVVLESAAAAAAVHAVVQPWPRARTLTGRR